MERSAAKRNLMHMEERFKIATNRSVSYQAAIVLLLPRSNCTFFGTVSQATHLYIYIYTYLSQLASTNLKRPFVELSSAHAVFSSADFYFPKDRLAHLQ